MKNQTLIISFLFLLLIFSCTSEEGKKFLQKFQKDEKLKFEIEQKIADTNGISVIADIENSYYGIDGKLKNEEVIFVPVKTKGDLQVYGKIRVLVTTSEIIKKEIVHKTNSKKWYADYMRKIKSKDRKIDLDNSDFKLRIEEQILGVLFKKRYGDLLKKFSNKEFEINGKKIILDGKNTKYYSKTNMDSLDNIKFKISNENLRGKILEEYAGGKLDALSNYEIEEILENTIQDEIESCNEKSKGSSIKYHCITNKPKNSLKSYPGSFYFMVKNDKNAILSKEEMQKFIIMVMESINYDMPEDYMFYFSTYEGESVGFYIENKKVEFIERN